MTKAIALFAILLPLLLVACTAPKSDTASSPQPIASFQDLMVSVIDPAADGVWEAVGTTTSASGVEEHAPRSEADWAAVRHHAVRLVEGGNLLLIEERPIVAPGRKVEDEHVAGVNNAQAIDKAIRTERANYVAAVRRLQAAGREALAAIDARDATRLLAAGDGIEKACEGCHQAFWYPNAQKPPPFPGNATAAASKP